MSAALRRQRLLRVRAVQHRVAAARLSAADASLSAILGIADRVCDLRAANSSETGCASGFGIQMAGELATRLDKARAGLDAPLGNARAACDIGRAAQMAAHIAEERVRRLDADASRRDDRARELRAAATQPFRRKTARGAV